MRGFGFGTSIGTLLFRSLTMATAFASTATAAVLGPHLSSSTPRRFPLLSSHRCSRSSSPPSLLLSPESQRSAHLRVRASSSEESSPQVDELLTDLKEKWDALENKPTVILYGGGAIVAVWLSSIIVGAINSVPLLPKMMELVGLGYTGCRKELATDIEALKKKIAGTGE